MKIKFLPHFCAVIVLLFTASVVFSQTTDFVCAVPDDYSIDTPGAFSKSIDPNYLTTFDPVVFNVYFWGINNDDGTSVNKLTENKALKVIAALNIKFNEANIFFKYYGYNYINSTFYSNIEAYDGDNPVDCNDPTIDDFNCFLDNNPVYEKGDAINFYIPQTTTNFAGAGSRLKLRAIIHSSAFDDAGRVVEHEMGHILGLIHTHNLWYDANYCEHVTRDKYLPDGITLNPDFNAETHGDRVVDTAAMPDFRNEKCIEDGYPFPYTNCTDKYFYIEDEPICSYSNPNGADCLVIPKQYEITTDDVRNLMAYTYGGCGRDLTDGQRIRMQERIIEDYPHYSATMNTVPSLYEPYKGEYYFAGPLPVNDKGGLNPPLFQYGFDYVFYDTSQADVYNQPTPWSFTNFWFGNVTQSIDVYHNTPITHPNHTAFKILQIDINNPRMCYNNYNRAPSGGTIIKFNDNVLNTNVTISPQDSMSINNEALIDDLDPGLYNVIKNYENGNTQETIILKENN